MYTQTPGNQPKPHIPTAPPHHHRPTHDHSHTPAATHVYSVVPGSRDMGRRRPDSYYKHRFIIIDRTIWLWDGKTGTRIATLGYSGWVDSLTFSVGGSKLVSAGKTV